MKPTTSSLMRLAGLSAVVAGLCFLVIGIFHPLNEPSAVNAAWVNVHIAATALGYFGLFGMAGLYARQVEGSGWLPPVYRLDDAGVRLFLRGGIYPAKAGDRVPGVYSRMDGDVQRNPQRG